MSGLLIDDISMRFDLPNGSAVQALQNVTLDIKKGEIVSVLGPSGCGKTTLLNIVAGFLAPTSGHVVLNGHNVTGPAAERGMVFQQGALFSAFTVLENIAFPLRELGRLPAKVVRDAALVKLQMVGLKPSDAGKMPADLSGGMIKRVALARSLIMDPALLFLDEPTAGLDPEGADDFCQLLKGLHQQLAAHAGNSTGKTVAAEDTQLG